jgi:hypothetical protein
MPFRAGHGPITYRGAGGFRVGLHGGRGSRFWGFAHEPVVFIEEVDVDDDGDDASDGVVSSGTAKLRAYKRGSRFFKDGDKLADLGKIITATPTSVALSTKLVGDHLTITACIDGHCYEGTADLSGIIAELEPTLRETAHRWHEQFHARDDQRPLVGADVVIGAVQERVSACGEALVGALIDEHHKMLCGSWWHDLTHKISSTVKSAAHEVTHPQELVHDVTHYALHPSDIAKNIATGLGAGAGLAKVLSYATDPLQDITENAQVQQLAATMYGGPAGVAALKAAQSIDSGASVAQTLQTMAPQIASAAAGAASQVAGPAAGQLAGALVNAAAGTGNLQQVATQAVNAATVAAASDPAAKAALDAAHQAVASVTAATHVANTIQQAASGNGDALSKVMDLTTAAAQGDQAAQNVVSAAQNMAGAAQGVVNNAGTIATDALDAAATSVQGWPAILLAAGGGWGVGRYGDRIYNAARDAWHKHVHGPVGPSGM